MKHIESSRARARVAYRRARDRAEQLSQPRLCTRCRRTLPATAFCGLRSDCRECHNAFVRLVDRYGSKPTSDEVEAERRRGPDPRFIARQTHGDRELEPGDGLTKAEFRRATSAIQSMRQKMLQDARERGREVMSQLGLKTSPTGAER